MEEILVGTVAGELPGAVERAHAVPGRGLEGDRYFAGSGTWSDYPDQTGSALTLVEAEVLEDVGLTGADARRNVVTRGIRLNDLVGKRFTVGGITCLGVRLCEPCTYLSGITGLPLRELVNRGGLRADVLVEGEIAVGDPVAVL